MHIAAQLQEKLKDNQKIIYITDADDLLAAWRYKRSSSTKRSIEKQIMWKAFRLNIDDPNLGLIP